MTQTASAPRQRGRPTWQQTLERAKAKEAERNKRGRAKKEDGEVAPPPVIRANSQHHHHTRKGAILNPGIGFTVLLPGRRISHLYENGLLHNLGDGRRTEPCVPHEVKQGLWGT